MSKLNDFDFLSPSITLYHYGKNKHSSKVGGVLTLIGICFCIAYTTYLCYEIFSHDTLSLLHYKKYEYEAGKYILDKDGIFHFIQLYNKKEEGHYGKYNSKLLRAFLSSQINTYPTNKKSIENNFHWVYDLCENNEDGINQSLFDNIDNLTNGACIKYYYDNNTKKYYNKTEKEFVYPFIEHGNSRRDNTVLGILIEKCSNDSILNNILGPCGTQEEIDNYFKENIAFYFYFIDNQVDPTDVYTPIKKYLNCITSSLSNTLYPVHNINFSPLLVKTDLNLLIKNPKSEYSFIFDSNQKDSKPNNKNSQILAEVSFWMQNNFIVYERNYKKIIDAFPTIGGIIEIVYYILYIINYFYNKYKIILHTKNLFLKIHKGKELNFEENDISKENFVQKFKNMIIDDKMKFKKISTFSKKNLWNNIDLKSYNNKIKNDQNVNFEQINNKESFNNNNQFIKYRVFSFRLSENNKSIEKSNIIDDSRNELNKTKGILKNTNNNITDAKENNYSHSINLNVNKCSCQGSTTKAKNIVFNDDNENRYNKFTQDIKLYMSERKKTIKCPYRKISFIENEFSFYTFIFSFCCSKTKKNGIYIFDHFRKKLLSEEHLYRAHIYLYLFEKYFEIEQEKADIVELYKYL